MIMTNNVVITYSNLFQLPSKERDKILNPVFTAWLTYYENAAEVNDALTNSSLVNGDHPLAKSANRIAPSVMAKLCSAKCKVLAMSRFAQHSAASSVLEAFRNPHPDVHADVWPLHAEHPFIEQRAERADLSNAGIEIEGNQCRTYQLDGTGPWMSMTRSPITSRKTKPTSQPTQETPDMTNEVTLATEQAEIVNTILDKYTNGTVKDIAPILKSHFTEVPELKSEIESLRTKLSAAPKTQLPQTRPSSGAIPSGKVVMRNAQKVFDVKSKLLDFEITTWEWDAPHPLVPEKFDNYRFDVTKLAQYLYGLEHNLNQWLVGHTGTGKSTWVEQVCAHTGYPLQRMNFDSDITRMEFVGSTQVVLDDSGQQVTQFVEGFLPKSMQMPCVMLLDEADAIQGDVAYVLQAVLEHKPFRLLEDSGRLIDPDPHFRIVATANTAGQGDPTGLYSAAIKSQSTAQRNRYNVFLEVDYMAVADEIALCKEMTPALSAGGENFLAGFLEAYRTGFTQGDVMEPISPRNTQTIAHSISFFEPLVGLSQAVAMSINMNLIARANDNDRAVIKGLVDRFVA
jgi:cobaltochelatase CobS